MKAKIEATHTKMDELVAEISRKTEEIQLNKVI